ncbi:MAG TPA: M3 family metallopeptidase [Bryobacteraceae bacterium]|nr:M3 family metallopeptidase [Bryobacteraceae bacterium]
MALQETKSSSEAANPLLDEQFPIPFQKIKAEHVQPAVEQLLVGMKARIDAIGSKQTPRTYEGVLAALDRATLPLDYAMAIVRHLESVATTPAFRAAHNAVQGPVSAFYSSIPLHPDLWSAVKAVDESTGAKSLTGVHKRFLEKTVAGFRRAGADLGPAGKKKLEALDVALTEATTRFSENVLDATNAYELVIADEAQLAGLPESARSAARESAKSKGRDGWRLTLQAPSYIAAMTYLDSRDIRRQLWEASNARSTAGAYDNRELLSEILRLRREKAELLGYRDFADLVLEERMAHTGSAAVDFLEDLREKTQAAFERENASLEAFARTLGYESLAPWDISYAAEKQRAALYDFDEEELRPYFQLDSVVAGMFEIFSRLLGIRVVEEPGVPGWDPAVKYYRMEDGHTGELLGGFYADWFPRENKRGGAWMDSLITGNPGLGEPHLGLICGNLTPPVGNTPSLLTHREVETIFHEFGHLLHHTLSRVPVRSLSGTNVPWDFVELPSQIMENWCMEREALDRFAKHYKTGEPIPEALFQKMKRARNFRSANAQMRQLGLGLVDLKLHREYQPERDGAVIAYSRAILARFTPAPLPENYGMIASFTHLFANPVGYGAGYYSYKWAEVLDADAFTRFRREGIFNVTTGSEYRRQILEKGDSDDPAQLYRNFMGRDPDANALLERSGLVAAA